MLVLAATAALVWLAGLAVAQEDAFDCPSDLDTGQYDAFTYYQVSDQCSDAGIADYCCVTFMKPTSPLSCLPGTVSFTATARDTLAGVVDEQVKKDGQHETSTRGTFVASFPSGVTAVHNRAVAAVWDVAMDKFRDKADVRDNFMPSRVYLTARKSGDWEDTVIVDFRC
ncbi:hypothetical protein O9K51_03323 [Purpureocillium lavendulum]|uniref:Uncharacterized protein n=1 Tax=Purpureocillium lavendulum TaxID=1247861 RepID=A0AB34G226_9HYPO|nr:hypothetical protein O9K51_03323 [Purpureocillium lavendulum]